MRDANRKSKSTGGSTREIGSCSEDFASGNFGFFRFEINFDSVDSSLTRRNQKQPVKDQQIMWNMVK